MHIFINNYHCKLRQEIVEFIELVIELDPLSVMELNLELIVKIDIDF